MHCCKLFNDKCLVCVKCVNCKMLHVLCVALWLAVKWAECSFVRDVNTSAGNLSKIVTIIITITICNSNNIIVIIIHCDFHGDINFKYKGQIFSDMSYRHCLFATLLLTANHPSYHHIGTSFNVVNVDVEFQFVKILHVAVVSFQRQLHLDNWPHH